MILDSNLVICSVRAEYPGLRRLISADGFAVSVITIVEVLGYHKLSQLARGELENFLAATEILPITDAIVASAVKLRQSRKMSLGDALIAATALIARRTLLTHNVKDFAWIPGLTVSNPLAAGDPP